MRIPPSPSCKKHSFDFGRRCSVIVESIFAVLNLVAKESFFCPPHTFSPSSLDGFDMAHILEKSGRSSSTPSSFETLFQCVATAKDSSLGDRAPYRREMLGKKLDGNPTSSHSHFDRTRGAWGGIRALYDFIVGSQGQIPQLDRARRLFVR